MADTQQILRHLAELYAVPTATKTVEEVAQLNFEKLEANYSRYDEAFADFLTADVMKAIGDFWKYKSDKVRPTLAQIIASLNSDGAEVQPKSADVETVPERYDEDNWKFFLNKDPALAYYKRDCATLPSDKVHALIFYRRALADIIAVNVDTLPNARKMSYSEKVAIEQRNNWLDDITEQVANLARESEGYNPRSVNQAVNALASHWRADK